MPRFLADENVKRDIISAVLVRSVDWPDIRTARDAGLLGEPDDVVLAWAAREGRVVISHDERTLIGFAYRRISEGLPMPGVLIIPWTMPLAAAIDAVVMWVEAGEDADFDGQVRYA